MRSVILNEGLEALGIDEPGPDKDKSSGVFEDSGLERVRLSSTLKRIEFSAFLGCARLRNIDFPEGLEYIGPSSF